MAEVVSNNDVATLQYQYAANEAYVIAIDDSKSHLEFVGLKFMNTREFLDDFIGEYKKDADKRKQGEIKEFVANDNKHAQVELSWKDEDVDNPCLLHLQKQKHIFTKFCAGR